MNTQRPSIMVPGVAAQPTTTHVANQIHRQKPPTSHKLNRTHNFSLQRRALHVLIVNDDQEIADEFAWWLHCGGHNPIIAYDGQTALRMAAMQLPDLVLLNLELPQMDGCQVAKQLRIDLPLKNCFIIGITWRTDEERRSQSIEAGIDLLLVMPIEMFLMETLLLLEASRVQRLLTEDISSGNSRDTVRVIRTDEEQAIARKVYRLMEKYYVRS